MKLIVGLGNVGKPYVFSRHNIGFMVLDVLASHQSWKKAHQSLLAKDQIQNTSILLAKPQTQMNLSGQAVKEIITYYQISTKQLLVVQDDVDQPFLNIKFQKNRGSGGHNGIKNIHQHLGHCDYYRLKIGVGRPSTQQDTSSYVLGSFTKKEQEELKEFLPTCIQAIECFVKDGGEKASNQYNQKNTLASDHQP